MVLLLIATFGLVWSMNRHLKKLPESFDRDDPGPDRPPTRERVESPGTDATAKAANPAQEPGGQPTG